MNPGKYEWWAVLALVLALGFRHSAWAPPAELDRAGYVALLLAAEAGGRSPLEEARRQGYPDEVLGRAAYHWGDLASEQAIAGALVTAESTRLEREFPPRAKPSVVH